MSVRRIVIYSGLTFSVASLAFSMGSWTAQRHIEEKLAENDARLTALSADLARGIERYCGRAHAGPLVSAPPTEAAAP